MCKTEEQVSMIEKYQRETLEKLLKRLHIMHNDIRSLMVDVSGALEAFKEDLPEIDPIEIADAESQAKEIEIIEKEVELIEEKIEAQIEQQIEEPISIKINEEVTPEEVTYLKTESLKKDSIIVLAIAELIKKSITPISAGVIKTKFKLSHSEWRTISLKLLSNGYNIEKIGKAKATSYQKKSKITLQDIREHLTNKYSVIRVNKYVLDFHKDGAVLYDVEESPFEEKRYNVLPLEFFTYEQMCEWLKTNDYEQEFINKYITSRIDKF